MTPISHYMKWKAGDFKKNFCEAIPRLIQPCLEMATSRACRGCSSLMKDIWKAIKCVGETWEFSLVVLSVSTKSNFIMYNQNIQKIYPLLSYKCRIKQYYFYVENQTQILSVWQMKNNIWKFEMLINHELVLMEYWPDQCKGKTEIF